MNVSAGRLATDRPSSRLRQTIGAIARAMRPSHWAKNLLVLVPTLTAHAWRDPLALSHALSVTVAFSLTASAIYLVNDVLDAPHDREHPVKRHRPVAAGTLTSRTALAVACILLGISWLIIHNLGSTVEMVLGGYALLMLGYAVWMKRVLALDIVVLAVGYTLRLAAGAAGIDVKLSPWLAAFALFVFGSLAMLKRAAELRAVGLRELAETDAAPTSPRHTARLVRGRAYTSDDLPIVSTLGAAAGMVAVMVLALYVTSPDMRALYGRPEVLWLLCPTVLFWLVRLWVLALRGVVREDPVLFAMRDLPSLAVLASCVAVVLLAL